MTTTVPAFAFRQGTAPLLVSMPHAGTHIPDAMAQRMTDAARRIPDTDWHMELLYDFLDEIGASLIVATHSRYVIDLNRPRDNANLYPGQDTTGLCPIDTFHKEPVYLPGQAPGEGEIAERAELYWVPYHAKLTEELARMRAQHGVAMLWDAHSIASVLPRFFDGRLTDLNLGTANGASCAPELGAQLGVIAKAAAGYTSALNGRFKGGHITRHFGHPEDGVHAVQLELAQVTYMNEDYPYGFDASRAAQLRPTLRAFLDAMLRYAEWAKRG